jgi:glyoxylase-like metal-dependent hydrolase (beta-lactamase superfamily II)
MINSIKKILSWKEDFIIYPGHGATTTLKAQANSLKNWLNYL